MPQIQAGVFLELLSYDSPSSTRNLVASSRCWYEISTWGGSSEVLFHTSSHLAQLLSYCFFCNYAPDLKQVVGCGSAMVFLHISVGFCCAFEVPLSGPRDGFWNPYGCWRSLGPSLAVSVGQSKVACIEGRTGSGPFNAGICQGSNWVAILQCSGSLREIILVSVVGVTADIS